MSDEAISTIFSNDERGLLVHINQANFNPEAVWSRTEVREIAAKGLQYIRYIRKLRAQVEKVEAENKRLRDFCARAELESYRLCEVVKGIS